MSATIVRNAVVPDVFGLAMRFCVLDFCDLVTRTLLVARNGLALPDLAFRLGLVLGCDLAAALCPIGFFGFLSLFASVVRLDLVPVLFLVFLGIANLSFRERTALACGFERGLVTSFMYCREYLSFNAILFFAFSYSIRGKFNLLRE